jgi:ATP-dependent DNA helicase Rep
VTTPKRGIGHQTLGSLGEFAAQVEGEPVRGAVSPSLNAALKGKAIESLHEFGREVNDLSTAPATPPGPRTPRRCCWAG